MNRWHIYTPEGVCENVVLSDEAPPLPPGYTASLTPPEPVVAPDTHIDAATLRERCEAAGIWTSVAALLVQSPVLMLTMLTSPQGVASNDPDARALITAAGGDPDAILA